MGAGENMEEDRIEQNITRTIHNKAKRSEASTAEEASHKPYNRITKPDITTDSITTRSIPQQKNKESQYNGDFLRFLWHESDMLWVVACVEDENARLSISIGKDMK
ncbi:hypothetical protein EYC80_009007 [Monilinia laxa]|uniref:Uncharacterized protein n=1 Tax=Monilinia laxa TaxID=61186 RepID=A0A5N6K237_MONLA|nr:hypothetical protein EYC80_009007 [Monilinia laxa]